MKKMFKYLILFTICVNQFVNAQESELKNPLLTSKFQLGAGIYFPSQKIKFSVDGSSENNRIEFDENFDFNNNQVTPEVYFKWRFSKRWSIYSEYFNANYGAKRELSNDIIAGDYTFEAGSFVKVGYKINLFRILFGYIISSGPKHEFGAGLGAHILSIKPFIEGNIVVNNDDNTFKKVSGSATAPVPNIALWYGYAPTQKWLLAVRLDWFSLRVNEYNGSLWDLTPSVNYQIIKNLGVAFDYRFFKTNANVNKDRWNGGVDLSFSGPTLTIVGNL